MRKGMNLNLDLRLKLDLARIKHGLVWLECGFEKWLSDQVDLVQEGTDLDCKVWLGCRYKTKHKKKKKRKRGNKRKNRFI